MTRHYETASRLAGESRTKEEICKEVEKRVKIIKKINEALEKNK